MNGLSFRQMVTMTLTDPAAAARIVVSIPLPTNALWLALVLGTVLNSILFSLSNILFPAPMPMPGLFGNPVFFALGQAGGLIVSVFALTWVGHIMGGRAQTRDVLGAMAWLQYMRFLGQAALILLSVALPGLTLIISLAILLISIWIVVHFLNVAHQFDSLGKSFLTLILAGLGLSVGLSILLVFLGATTQGMLPNV